MKKIIGIIVLIFFPMAIIGQQNPFPNFLKKQQDSLSLKILGNQFGLSPKDKLDIDHFNFLGQGLALNDKVENRVLTSENSGMPIFEQKIEHNMPVFSIDSTRIYHLKVYPAKPY